MKTSKIRVSAHGEECTVRLAGICNFNPETVIFAHKGGGGMGMKSSDIHGAYCCSAYHDLIDGRSHSNLYTNKEVETAFYEGIFRTQLILIEKGLISLK